MGSSPGQVTGVELKYDAEILIVPVSLFQTTSEPAV